MSSLSSRLGHVALRSALTHNVIGLRLSAPNPNPRPVCGWFHWQPPAAIDWLWTTLNWRRAERRS